MLNAYFEGPCCIHGSLQTSISKAPLVSQPPVDAPDDEAKDDGKEEADAIVLRGTPAKPTSHQNQDKQTPDMAYFGLRWRSSIAVVRGIIPERSSMDSVTVTAVPKPSTSKP